MKKPARKSKPKSPLRIISKFDTIGLPLDELRRIDEKAELDKVAPLGSRQPSRVTSYCFEKSVRHLSSAAAVLRLATKLSASASAHERKLVERMKATASELSRLMSQATYRAKAAKKL
jgi:hypothetical protein